MPAVTPFLAPKPLARLPTTQVFWRASELAQAHMPVLPTGYAALDAQLPGGGWPVGALVELLQDQSARHDWQLIAPALAARLERHCGPVLLVGPPHWPFAPALAALGLPVDRLLCVGASDASAQLWAVEQALRCAQVAAVLAWLPAARSQALRRLHLAAQAHSQLFFMFRPAQAQRESSPAPLRLLLSGSDEPTALRVHILKRRGPVAPAPLQLPTQQQRLHALLAAAHARRERAAASIALPPVIADLIEAATAPADVPAASSGNKHHALDSLSADQH